METVRPMMRRPLYDGGYYPDSVDEENPKEQPQQSGLGIKRNEPLNLSGRILPDDADDDLE